MDGMSFESVYIKMVFPYHFMGIVLLWKDIVEWKFIYIY